MRFSSVLVLSASLCLAVIGFGHLPSFQADHADVPASRGSSCEANPPLAVCFDQGTPEEYVIEWTRRLQSRHALDFRIGDRWGHTATNPGTGVQGDPITLTYSFVPDGVIIDGQPSQLFSRMNQLFGNQQTWQNLFAQVFDRWSQLTGLRYELEQDDGASFGQGSPGVLGVRGDVRIGSVTMDGSSGVLAYNYYPDIGDMVLDAAENWASSGQNYIFLRNIVAHEHGHGWGLAHVCPTNSTKLLEPYYSSVFNGPQHDDIRGGQRNYGDTFENNDDVQSASSLGQLAEDYVLADVSLDDNSDLDYYSFSVPAGKGVSLTLSPVGYQYLEGPQNGDGSCGESTQIYTLDDQNLDLYLRDASGTNVLAQSALHQAGESEFIYRFEPPDQGGSYMVEVSGATANAVQLYWLSFDLFNLADPYLSESPLDFDTTQINAPVTLPLVIHNPGTQNLLITSISTSGPFNVTPTGAHTVPPQGSLELSVTYDALSLGTQTGVLTILHNGPGGSLECPLIGTSITSSIEFVSGTSVDFGDVPINTQDSVGVVIRAQGNVPLGITGLMTSPPFSLAAALPYWLNPNQAIILRPYFHPTELGEYNGILVIEHTAPSSPDTIYLHGIGTPNLGTPDRRADVPNVYRLDQNFPNPFNPATTIAFDLPRSTHAKLEVYDLTGRLVQELVDGYLEAGHHFVQFDGGSFPSGMFVYRLTTPDFNDLHKMMLLR